MKFTARGREHSPYTVADEDRNAIASRVELDMPWDDVALVAGLKQGDSSAVRYAVENFAPRIYRFALYQLGDHSAAEDLVSEVMTRMLEKIGQYNQTGAPFQAWLFSIARNLMHDSHRRRKNTTIISLDAAIDTTEVQSLGATDTRIDGFADRDALLRVMSQLTDEQRQILTLRIVEGWQPQEIAELLGKSIDSVKSLQYRALQTLKRLLGNDE
ncbi:MAG: RNA polymerase sigma factor [Chloroflexota bacterium]